MPRLSFSALLTKGEDVDMTDAPALSLRLPSLDFHFELDDLEVDLVQAKAGQGLPDSEDTDIELRSPRTPTFINDVSYVSGTIIPFDAEKFLKSPIASPNNLSSPLTALAYSPAAQTRIDLRQEIIAEKENRTPSAPPPPKSPLLWIWTCHLCRSRYPLGATRRCLIDGHYYCSGDNSTTQKNIKKKKRGQACSSEFDYVGWQEWGEWKKDIVGIQKRTNAVMQSVHNLKGCGGCRYPSECRYDRMNKVPEVVAALTKKADCLVELETKTVGREMKKDMASRYEKKRNLKVDTSVPSSRRSKKKDQAGEKPTGIAVDGPQPTSTSRQDSADELVTIELDGVHPILAQSKSNSNPSSPELVDLASIMVEVDYSMDNTLNKGSTKPENGTAHTNELMQSSSLVSDNSTDGEVLDAGSICVAKLNELPKLQRAKSRKKGQLVEKSSIRKSRVSDFFGVTK